MQEQTNDKFYHSPRWERLRARILRRDKYMCQLCKRYGRMIEATEVHHIKHLEDCPEEAFNPSNLVSLCHSCHNRQHPEKTAYTNLSRERRKY